MLKEDVLYTLERQRGELVTGGRLAGELGVSRTAIWKAVKTLQEDGNEIASVTGSGYRLLETNDTLSHRIISENLNTEFIGRKMTLLSSVRSTNQYLKELGAEDTPNGYVVIANGQTSGRGRRNREFLSPKGEGLYMSILLKLDRAATDIRPLTLCAAVAAAKAIEAVCGVRADIKWVNDIYVGGKKICGILTEAVLSGELQELTTVIIGIGVNTGGVPPEIGGIATSVREAAGLRGTRNRLAAEVLNQFEPLCRAYSGGSDRQALLKAYEERLFIRNKKVLVTAADNSYAATVIGIDEAGALVVEDDAGIVRHIVSGEISLDWRR